MALHGIAARVITICMLTLAVAFVRRGEPTNAALDAGLALVQQLASAKLQLLSAQAMQHEEAQSHAAPIHEDVLAEQQQLVQQLLLAGDEEATCTCSPSVLKLALGDLQVSADIQAQLRQLLSLGQQQHWLLDCSKVVLGEAMGQGTFGTAYRATLNTSEVAVKVVHVAHEAALLNLLREVEVLAAVRHPCVLRFLGLGVAGPAQFWLLTEFMAGGNLEAWLAKEEAVAVPRQQQGVQLGGQRQGQGSAGGGLAAAKGPARRFAERLRIVLQVAQGLAALHRQNPPVLHRDLKPTNVFVDSRLHARVGDFGLARRLPLEQQAGYGPRPPPSPTAAALSGPPGLGLTCPTGTLMFMAPEVFLGNEYDAKADVWSWGVLLVKVMAGVHPYEHLRSDEVAQAAAQLDKEDFKLNIPSSWPFSLQRHCGLHRNRNASQLLAESALHPDPDCRPLFPDIVEILRPLHAMMEKEAAREDEACARSSARRDHE
ncbi:hypothetical protein QJQ45_005114 [Haematococcus lacustris]|nr:hypothetical protein QJQ45_005114 [Haematococcus lacustris]